MTNTLSRRSLVIGGASLATFALPGLALARIKQVDIDKLKPGAFIWRPDLSPSGPVAVIVSLGDQRAYVYRNGIRIGVSTISSGKKGYATPTGVFTVYSKQKMHHSRKYKNAPMPDSQFFYGGAALHAGGLPGYPSSHGCVHLPKQFAALLFGVTQDGTPVVITNEKFGVGSLAHAGFMMTTNDLKNIAKQTGNVKIKTGNPEKQWDSHKAYSVIVSSADRKVIVLRNGSVFYEAPITIKGMGKIGEHVYQLAGQDANGEMKWIAIDTLGKSQKSGMFPDTASKAMSRVSMDQQAQMYISTLLRPGSTVVFTDFSAGKSTRTGNDFVVLNVKQ